MLGIWSEGDSFFFDAREGRREPVSVFWKE